MTHLEIIDGGFFIMKKKTKKENIGLLSACQSSQRVALKINFVLFTNQSSILREMKKREFEGKKKKKVLLHMTALMKLKYHQAKV